MNVYLKVKIKSLAAEAKIIRAEERKSSKSLDHAKTPEARDKANARYCGLRGHRTGIVREEARYSLIAYGYLRSVPYAAIETTERTPDWERVMKIAQRFGAPRNLTPTALEEWAATE